jgi:hypothetical protein
LEVVEEQVHTPQQIQLMGVAVSPTLASIQMVGKIFDGTCVQSCGRLAVLTCPVNEVFCCAYVSASRNQGVARLAQFASETFKQAAFNAVAKLSDTRR